MVSFVDETVKNVTDTLVEEGMYVAVRDLDHLFSMDG